MAPKSYYQQTPAVPKKKVAGTNPMGQIRLGSTPPPSVPRKPARTPSLVQPIKIKKPKAVRKH